MRSVYRAAYLATAILTLALIAPWAIAQAGMGPQNMGQGQGMGSQNMGQGQGQMGQGQGQMGQGQGQIGQGHMGQNQGHMSQGQGMWHYDPSAVVTEKGTVQEVQQGTTAGHMGGMGVHLVVKTSTGTQTILVGPQNFLTQKNFSFNKGDKIEVTGSKVKSGTSEAIIARDIKKGDQTLTLRNENGAPLWSGGGRQ